MESVVVVDARNAIGVAVARGVGGQGQNQNIIISLQHAQMVIPLRVRKSVRYDIARRTVDRHHVRSEGGAAAHRHRSLDSPGQGLDGAICVQHSTSDHVIDRQ